MTNHGARKPTTPELQQQQRETATLLAIEELSIVEAAERFGYDKSDQTARSRFSTWKSREKNRLEKMTPEQREQRIAAALSHPGARNPKDSAARFTQEPATAPDGSSRTRQTAAAPAAAAPQQVGLSIPMPAAPAAAPADVVAASEHTRQPVPRTPSHLQPPNITETKTPPVLTPCSILPKSETPAAAAPKIRQSRDGLQQYAATTAVRLVRELESLQAVTPEMIPLQIKTIDRLISKIGAATKDATRPADLKSLTSTLETAIRLRRSALLQPFGTVDPNKAAAAAHPQQHLHLHSHGLDTLPDN